MIDLPDHIDNSTRKQMAKNLLQPEHNIEAMKTGSNMMFKFSKLGEFVDVYVDHDIPSGRKCGRSKTGKGVFLSSNSTTHNQAKPGFNFVKKLTLLSLDHTIG